ncbi:amino acid adenylation domain-containing protein, partial [Noviherbaspirillum sp.]|uniref:amino acid adenylation domain-containing protein n=1 Tax=Noviherbaspirillum sp. TaxID=1926288 RepID=UPI002FDF3BEB
FQLGGHSLLAVSLIERMRNDDLQADVRALFSTPTVAALALVVGGESRLVDVPANRIEAGCDAITPDMLPLVNLSEDDIARIVVAVPGGAANIQDIYPLAPLQEGILFHHLMSSEGDPYLLGGSYGFQSRDRLDTFLQALQAVVDRHDILRTAFLWQGLPEPVQVVCRSAPIRVEELELDREKGGILQQLEMLRDPRHYRLDIRTAPLMQACIAYDADNQRWLMRLLSHHLWGDHSTLDVVMEELQAHMSGDWEKLPSPLPFRNFIAQTRLGTSRDAHEAFFTDMLADIDEPTMPFGLSGAQLAGTDMQEAASVIEPGVAARMRKCARSLGVNAASLFHLAMARVLAQASNRDDVVFGTVLFGRMQGEKGVDRAVGLFMNTLPLRIRPTGAGVRDSVRQTHALLAQLLHHEHAPLALAQRCSGVAAPAPLFSAVLNYRHSISDSQLSAASRRAWDSIETLGNYEGSSYPFILSIDDDGDNFFLTAHTHRSINPALICAYFRTTLAGMVHALENRPDLPVDMLDILPASERQRLLVEWNSSDATHCSDKCIHQLFEQRVHANSEAVALVFEDVELRYGELNARANRVARQLRKFGVEPDARVAICMDRGIDMVVGLLAVLKAGGAYVPLDPSYPPERIAFMLEDCAPVVLLTHAAVRTQLQPLHAIIETSDVAGLPIYDLDTQRACWMREDDDDLDADSIGLDSAHLAYVIYTSGSTGTPKGVMVEHRQLINHINWQVCRFGFTDADAVLQRTSMSFDASVWEIWTPLAIGARLVLLPSAVDRDPAGIVRTIKQQKVTIAQFVPSMLRLVLQEHEEPVPLCDFLFSGGEVLDAELARRAHECSRRAFTNLYGPTETTVDALAWTVDGASLGATGQNTVPIGRPIDNALVYILDGRRQPVPVGAIGEIYVGGSGVARGYWNRPELTSERFVADPFCGRPEAGAVRDGHVDRMYRTGDLGRYLPDGNIEFKGRNDHQVKLRGYRIEPGEIASVLLTHPCVRDAVVLARMDGSGNQRLVAYYTTGAQQETAPGSLHSHLSKTLPEYMLPETYVKLDALPLTPNGKLDRLALPVPEDHEVSERAYEVPEGEVETALASIWADVLQVERVGRHDDFFQLGGHSLLAMKVMSRIRRLLGVEPGINELFAHPTLAALATAVSRAARSELPAITVVSREEALPLSFAQQRLLFLAQMDGVSQAYHIPVGLRLHGALDRLALRRALDRVVERHEALRTTFIMADGVPLQRIAAGDTGFTLQEHDLRGVRDAEEELVRISDAEALAPFDLESGPLVRGRLLQLKGDEHVLLVTMHHIVSDGWSQGILINEFSSLYNAFCADDDDPLPPLAIQYADYAAWQRRWVGSEVLQQQAQFWQRTLAGAPAVLELPVDRPRPSQPVVDGAGVDFELDEALTQDLKALSRRHGATLFMTVLAGWAVLLSRLSGQDDVVIGSPVANRTRAEVEPLIGLFLNTLALRVDLADGPSVAELLRRVKEQTLNAQENQDLPFEQVVEGVNPPRSVSYHPLFQVLINWQNNESVELRLSGLSLSPAETTYELTKFDLALNLAEADDRIIGAITYATSLFDRSTIARYAELLQRVFQAMVRDDQQLTDRLSILDAPERTLVVDGWNATQRTGREGRF